ncbi:MAG: PAS domain S-box protein [bacterium]|nr:PAS domain S-box protein [bacterium]
MSKAKKTKAELVKELEAAQSRISELEDRQEKPNGIVPDVETRYREMFEDSLRYRMKFEEVIANISANFISLPFEKTDEAINNSLESIGRFCGVDRSCVTLFSEDMETMSDTHEWCNEDIEPRINDLQEVPLGLFAERMEEFKRTGIISTPHLEDLPPGTEIEKEMSDEHGTKSYILVAITSEGRVIGFISLNMVRKEREWEDGDIALLKIAANIFANVIERQKKVGALRESEQRLRNLLDTTTDWVWEIDENGVYTYSSPGVKKTLGYEPDDILGMSPFDLMPEEEADRLADTIGPVFAARKPIKLLDNVYLHVKGNAVVLETNAVPFFDPDGEFRGYRGIDRDVTEIKRARDGINKSG